jgi:hypothetical protein
VRFGYIVATKRAPETGGRALAHYTIARPSVEDLQREITAHIQAIRSREPKPFPIQLPADVTSVGNIRKPPDVTGVGNDTPPDVTHGGDVTDVGNVTHVVEADVTYVVPTVTSKRTSSKKEGSPSDEGLPADPEFDVFWAAFPDGRKKGKGAVHALFRKIASGKHKSLRASAAALIDGARRYAASAPDPKYVPLPATWLNEGRWMDDTPAGQQRAWWQDPSKVAAADWRKGIEAHARETWPVSLLGPPPGSLNCVVPPSLVAELRLTELYTDKGIRRR